MAHGCPTVKPYEVDRDRGLPVVRLCAHPGDPDPELSGWTPRARAGGRGVSGWYLWVYLSAGSVDIMIVAADGKTISKIEKQYDPRLAKLLMALDHVLHEQGLGLFCTKCHRLGLKDGVRGESTEKEYVLECGCARRSWVIETGLCTVQMQ
jgi:hypothetical protein